MTIHVAKPFDTEFVANQDFMKRSGIYWRWGGSTFDGHTFGTSLGPTHCFMQAGLHDFAHCIDFILNGKANRITPYGLKFETFWEQWIEALGIMDGDPKTSGMTRCEGRTFALQAYLMNKELGFIVDSLDYDEEHDLRVEGKLDHIPEDRNEDGSRIWGRDNSLLKTISIEQFAKNQGKLETFKWKDDNVFLTEHGCGYSSGLPYAERKERWKECFSQFILNEYERLQSPIMEKQISKAISVLAQRLRRFHKSRGFNPADGENFGLLQAA